MYVKTVCCITNWRNLFRTPTCSSLIPSGRRLDYIPRVQLEFRENSGAFRLTLSENRLGLDEKSLITSDAAGIH